MACVVLVVALTKFRGTDDIEPDIQEMKQEQRQKVAEPEWSFKELLKSKELRTPLYIVCALATCQQLSGINVVSIYSVSNCTMQLGSTKIIESTYIVYFLRK